MHFQFILLLGFVIGAQACCPISKTPKKSTDCNKCSECLDQSGNGWPKPSDKSWDFWCNSLICGSAIYAETKCHISYEGFCGLDKCENGVNNWKFLIIIGKNIFDRLEWSKKENAHGGGEADSLILDTISPKIFQKIKNPKMLH